MIFKSPFLTIVFLLSCITSSFAKYFNTTTLTDTTASSDVASTNTDETTTVTSKITMYVTLGSETYTYLRTPLVPLYTGNYSGSSNHSFNIETLSNVPTSYWPTTTLTGYFNTTSY